MELNAALLLFHIQDFVGVLKINMTNGNLVVYFFTTLTINHNIKVLVFFTMYMYDCNELCLYSN